MLLKRSALIALLTSALTMVVASPANAQWGGAGLFTEEGLEVTADSRVFTLFALLNAVGYNEESRFGKPPLKAPQFSKARAAFRDSLRRPGGAIKDFDALVEANPGSVKKYLKAALSLSASPEFKKSKSSKLGKKMSKSFRAWFNKAGGSLKYRTYAKSARESQKKVLAPLAALTKKIAASVRLGDEEDQVISDDTGPTMRATVVINELDAYGSLHRVKSGNTLYVITGPFADDAAVQGVAELAALSYARTLVDAAVEKAKGPGLVADAYKGLSKAERKGFKNRNDFVGEVVGCALVMHANAKATCANSRVEKSEKAMALAKSVQKRIAASDAAKELASVAIPKWLGLGA